MIVLYVILLGHTSVPDDDLIQDVKKSHAILSSMEEASVARRSAALLNEVLKVAQACVQQRNVATSYAEQSRVNGESAGVDQRVEVDETFLDLENDFSRTLFSHAAPGQGPGEVLATLIDPNLLQDFTATEGDFSYQDFSAFSMGDQSDDFMNLADDGVAFHL